MDLKLPHIIRDYVEASNAHDVEAILACFSEAATVRDENETLHGKAAIKAWVVKTIGKYDFHFEPLRIHEDDGEILLAVSVSGTFPGSPIALDYQFTIAEGKISSLSVE
jgi:ketosteroid isomerase-like protein